jgi:hypothetical protein
VLTALAPDLYVCPRPQRFFGVPVGTRMTIAALGGGRLFVHSPVALDDALKQAVAALGEPAVVVAPNRYHHLFMGQWMSAYPAARAFAAPGLAEKRRDLAFAGVLGDAPDAAWADALDQLAWQGAPTVSEVVFLHRASRTLIVADLVHNLGPEQPSSTKIVFSLLGGYGGMKTTLIDRLVTRDPARARASLDRVLAWDFDRVTMCHGAPLDAGGKQSLARAFAWLA